MKGPQIFWTIFTIFIISIIELKYFKLKWRALKYFDLFLLFLLLNSNISNSNEGPSNILIYCYYFLILLVNSNNSNLNEGPSNTLKNRKSFLVQFPYFHQRRVFVTNPRWFCFSTFPFLFPSWTIFLATLLVFYLKKKLKS